jgi:hypothetical protein
MSRPGMRPGMVFLTLAACVAAAYAAQPGATTAAATRPARLEFVDPDLRPVAPSALADRARWRAAYPLAAAALPLAGRPEDGGLAADPADCRVARLVLGLFDMLHYPVPAMVGFFEGGEQLARLYTDRPCRVTGAIDLQRSGTFVDLDPALRARFAGRYAHAIDAPAAGLHWLRVRRDGPASFVVVPTDAPSGMLSVFALLPGVTIEAAPSSTEKPWP